VKKMKRMKKMRMIQLGTVERLCFITFLILTRGGSRQKQLFIVPYMNE
jgi:hypothetical protein